MTEGMALTKEMLIFANAMQIDGFSVQIETMVLIIETAFRGSRRPFHFRKTNFRLYAVHNLVHTPLHHRCLNRIELRILKRPMLQFHFPHGNSLTHNLR